MQATLVMFPVSYTLLPSLTSRVIDPNPPPLFNPPAISAVKLVSTSASASHASHPGQVPRLLCHVPLHLHSRRYRHRPGYDPGLSLVIQLNTYISPTFPSLLTPPSISSRSVCGNPAKYVYFTYIPAPIGTAQHMLQVCLW